MHRRREAYRDRRTERLTDRWADRETAPSKTRFGQKSHEQEVWQSDRQRQADRQTETDRPSRRPKYKTKVYSSFVCTCQKNSRGIAAVSQEKIQERSRISGNFHGALVIPRKSPNSGRNSFFSGRVHTQGGHATARFLEGFLEGSLTASAS